MYTCTDGGIADGEEVRDMLKLRTSLLRGFPLAIEWRL
jgi:hypothetical protein